MGLEYIEVKKGAELELPSILMRQSLLFAV
jgi:hypothetical protein